jgi:hypothetical protein
MAKKYCRKELAQTGEQMPEPADHRIVAPDRVAGLEPVEDIEQDRQEDGRTHRQQEGIGHELQTGECPVDHRSPLSRGH